MSAPVEEKIAVETGAEVPVEAPVAEPSKDVAMADDPDTDRKARARRQVEFYFADSNLPYDKFMWQLHSKTPEHWVSIEAVASFKRMRQYSQGENGLKWVADALRESEYLEVDETGINVRRKTEVKEPKGQFDRSVYAKGFEGDESNNLQQRLEDFFQGYGSTNEVRLRRNDDKSFKGSVFVEFTEPSGVEAFLKADPKPSWNGADLVIMTKEDYCEMKIKEKGLTGKNAERKRDNMVKRAFNAFTTPLSQGGLFKLDDKKEIWLEFMGKKLRIERDDSGNGRVNEEEIPFVKGSTLKFEGVGENFSWSDIKLPLKDIFEGRTPYIDYTRGQNDGLVGFHKELSDEDILAVKKAVRTINGNEITWSSINEEDEKKFQIRRAQSGARAALRSEEEKQSSSSESQRGGRGGSRGGRGGRGGRGAARGGAREDGNGRGRGRGRGGRGRGRETRSKGENGASANGSTEAAGEKRKRGVESTDGGPDVGIRGVEAPPVLQTTKKTKIETGEAATATASS
ncbi:hypothetical protein BT96DRAFT_866347 [Gymnopus androsaceus JB14]|uniref:HTH La-type RNA-binding domain-containing protein n=1 Tax=Gymnopus androsaceus JB14 TaxID=1447944 RepID=A0A6A4GUE9_9AGAR|nr:hypothetical protein BT96DRAFT_866347 [Gymnopus androsaceus JB14]